MTNRFLKAQDVAELLDVSVPFAYSVIRELNDEMKGAGFRTTRGRVVKEYFCDRYGFNIVEEQKEMSR